MTDLITRARKEWCEPPASETTLTHYGTKIIVTPKGSQCPPSVVAALLDLVVHEQTRAAWCPLCGTEKSEGHSKECHLYKIEAAITRTLEQKP